MSTAVKTSVNKHEQPLVVLVSSVISHPEVPMVSSAAIEQQDLGKMHKVPAVGNPGGGTSFDLLKKGCRVKNLALWSDVGRLRGARIIFEDDTVMHAGQIEGGLAGNSISFDPTKSITESTILPSAKNDRVGCVQLQTTRGQKYQSVAIGNFPPSPPDMTQGVLIGVYGSAGADLDSLGLILALPEDVEYQLKDIVYDLTRGTITKGKSATVNLKEGMIENHSGAPIIEKLTFSHKYTETKTWEIAAQIKAGLKLTVKGGVPLAAEGGLEASLEGTFGTKDGGSVSDEKTDTYEIDVTVLEGNRVRVKGELVENKVNVPYTATLDVTRSDNSVVTKRISGTFRGSTVAVYNVRAETIPLKPAVTP